MADVLRPGPDPAPLFNDVADGPEGGSACWLTCRDSVRIRVAHWGTDAPNGTVILFPGRSEYIEKYGRTARDLLDRGFATLAVDWRGQGIATRLLSNRALGHVARFGDYQADVAAVVAHARALNLPEPYFLLAHSMGGCIGLRALIDGLPVRAVAFTSPMWGIRVSSVMRPVAWTLSTLSKPLRFSHTIVPGQVTETYLLTAPFEGNTLTTDPDMWDYLKAQVQAHPDLALGGPTLHWLHESLIEMRRLARLPSPAIPCLTFMGTDEDIVEPGPIIARMAKWPEGRLVTLQGARHEVLMERPATRRAAIDDIAAHFLHGRAAVGQPAIPRTPRAV